MTAGRSQTAPPDGDGGARRRLAGTRILAIAGAGTIGRPVCVRLGTEGARVAVADRDLAAAERIAAEITSAGGTAIALPVDVTDESTVAAAVAAVRSAFGGLDGGFVNVADLSPVVLAGDTDAVSIDLEVYDHVMAVNLRGHLVAVKHLVPALIDGGGGPLVHTSSAGAYLASPSMVAYAMAKSGLNALVRHVATAYGKQGVRANAVAPGLVLDEANGRPRDPAVLDHLLSRTLADRLGRPDDIPGLVALLLSDDGSWITGQVISVDGGITHRP